MKKKYFTRRKLVTLNSKVYTIIGVIDEGGQGVVYLVKSNDGSKLALKKFSFNSHEAFEVARREIAIMKLIKGNKNIVEIIDSEIIKNEHETYEVMILMEYCSEPSVASLLKSVGYGGLPFDVVLKISLDITMAVKQLHLMNPSVIHRDIKIENLLQNKKNDFVLIDYGSATRKIYTPQVDNAIAIQNEIDRYTTLAYRSPEMINLYDTYPITTKSDIWSLGCAFYKLIYNSTPFGENKINIQFGKLNMPYSPCKNIDDQYKDLIKSMLHIDPEARPNILSVENTLFKIINKNLINTTKICHTSMAVTSDIKLIDIDHERPIMLIKNDNILIKSTLQDKISEKESDELMDDFINMRLKNPETTQKRSCKVAYNKKSDIQNSKIRSIPLTKENVNLILENAPFPFKETHKQSLDEVMFHVNNSFVEDK